MGAKEIWCGMFHVIPPKEDVVFEGAIGAFVNVLAYSFSYEEYLRRAIEYLEYCEFSIIEYENVRVFAPKDSLKKDWIRALDDLSPQAPIQFTDFQSYQERDDS